MYAQGLRPSRRCWASLFVLTVVSVLLMATSAFADGPPEAAGSPWRTDESGSVMVEANLQLPGTASSGALSASAGEIRIELLLTTHSGDLTRFDMAAAASLRTDRGEAAPGAIRWELERPSSHHPVGRLVIQNRSAAGQPLVDAATTFVELTIRNLGGVKERVLRWDLGPNYRVFVPNAVSGTVSEIDPHRWEVVKTYTVGEEAAHGVATTLDGRELYAGNAPDGQVLVFDLATGAVVATIDVGGRVHGLDITPNGRYVLVAGTVPVEGGEGLRSGGGQAGGDPDGVDEAEATEGYVAVIDTRTRKTVARIDPGAGDIVGHIDFTPDSRLALLAVVSDDKLIALDLEKMSVKARIDVGDGPNESRVSPDGREAYVANWLANEIAVVDLKSLQVVARIPSGEGTHGVAVSADGSQLWVANRKSNDISLIDTATRKVTRTLASGEYANHVAFTPDGRWVLVSNMREDSVVVFNRASGEVVARVPVGAEPHEFSFATVAAVR